MPELHETRVGRVFFERHVPEIALQLARIADALERLLEAREPGPAAPKHEPDADEDPA